MIDEGCVRTNWRRYGASAFLRLKQWWSFEGLDVERRVYFVFLAMQSFPAGYVSLTAIDLDSGKRTVSEQLTEIRSAAGDSVSVSAKGKWGRLAFHGRAEEKWSLDIDTGAIKASIVQTPRSTMHRNNLLSKRIDYSILQSVRNDIEGTISFGDREYRLNGYGYCEHAWGVQPRLSAANWFHFWSPDVSGVVMDCMYDGRTPHHYTLLWADSEYRYLHSPARFSFNPNAPDEPFNITSPDLNLTITPFHNHRMIKKIPPVLPYINIDYFELLVKAKGAVSVEGAEFPIEGIGKYDHNYNRW